MFESVAPGVGRLGIVFVNVFALGEPGGPWLLIDAGLFQGRRDLLRSLHGRPNQGGHARLAADAYAGRGPAGSPLRRDAIEPPAGDLRPHAGKVSGR